MNNNTDFVVTRHDVALIEVFRADNWMNVAVSVCVMITCSYYQELLFMMLAVPLALWSASCCCVVFISCCIKIDDWGHFRVSIVASKVPTISSYYLGFHNVPSCDEAQPRQAKECLERGQGWEIQREGNGEPSAEASPAIGTTRGLVMVAGSPFTASFYKSISEDSVM